MREGGESSISRRPWPGVETFHIARQRSQIRELMLRLQVVSEIGRMELGGELRLMQSLLLFHSEFFGPS
jgi:hypothetical protein